MSHLPPLLNHRRVRKCAAAGAAAVLAGCLLAAPTAGSPADITVATPEAPPEWALLQREVLRAHLPACREYFARYYDDRGFLLCVERWGGDDGPDDAAECVNDWPLLHALGGDDAIRTMYRRAWEGHLRQYTLARTTDVPLARDGMYYKEFPTQFDWLHNGEGLAAFNLHGLSDPHDDAVIRRARRYAGFYLGDDPGAPNYDPHRKLIRSMFNGSRGPLLRKATALDWAGDPIEVENRFRLGHGEKSYEEMLLHFRDYNDVVGDHPQNLLTTNLATNAFLLTGEERYRTWVVEYVGAWRDRMRENGGIIPSNVGRDGTIGGDAGGKWYGGVYGWGFSVYDPASKRTAHRNQVFQAFTGFLNAAVLTGDEGWLEPWRRQAELINARGRMEDGVRKTPRMHGDQGWYDYQAGTYDYGALETYLFTLKETDRKRAPGGAWLDYLEGRRPNYPVEALRADLARIRERVRAMRADPTTPDTRLADDPMAFNPVSVTGLGQLTVGSPSPPRYGNLLHAQLRYFDPERRRSGLPPDTAALLEKMEAGSLTIRLVNLHQSEGRTVILRAGSFGEHRFTGARWDGGDVPLGGRDVAVRLEPGCGGTLHLRLQRRVNRPLLGLPWNLGRE